MPKIPGPFRFIPKDINRIINAQAPITGDVWFQDDFSKGLLGWQDSSLGDGYVTYSTEQGRNINGKGSLKIVAVSTNYAKAAHYFLCDVPSKRMGLEWKMMLSWGTGNYRGGYNGFGFEYFDGVLRHYCLIRVYWGSGKLRMWALAEDFATILIGVDRWIPLKFIADFEKKVLSKVYSGSKLIAEDVTYYTEPDTRDPQFWAPEFEHQAQPGTTAPIWFADVVLTMNE